MSEELDTEAYEVLDSSVSVRTSVIAVHESESDTDSSRTAETAERDAARGTDLQCPTFPYRMDVNSEPLTAAFQNVRCDNFSSALNVKDSGVSESGESSLLVDNTLSCSQPVHNLPQPVTYISTAASSLQQGECDVTGKDPPSVSVSSSEQCRSDIARFKALLSTVLEQRQTDKEIPSADHCEGTAESARPSTVVIISTREGKDSSTSCQVDLNCTSSDVNDSADDGIPQSVADLYMCCSDDDTASATELTSDSQTNKHSDSADCAPSRNDNERISDDTSTMKRVVLEKHMTANGMAFLQ